MVNRLRTKTIISIIVVILTVSGCYLFYYINKQQENVRLLIDSQKKQIQTLLKFYTEQIDKQYSSRLLSFIDTRKNIINLFADKEIQDVYNETLPVYSLLKKENPYFEQIVFLLPDDNVFLNMNDFRPDAVENKQSCVKTDSLSLAQGKTIGGFVHGMCGLTYAILAPVYKDNKLAGSILFGIRIDAFIEDIQKNLGIKTALAITNTDLDLGTVSSPRIVTDEYSLYPYGDKFFTDHAAELDMSKEEQEITHEDGKMIVFASYRIHDMMGNKIGILLQALNLSAIAGSYQVELIRLALVTLAVIVVASLILYWNFDKILTELVKLNTSLNEKYHELQDSEKYLEQMVAERTEELEKTNIQLQQEINRRRDANISLSRSIEEWQSTFDAITDPVTILDKDLEVVIANKAAHKLLTRSKEEIVGKKCYELFFGTSKICEKCPAQEVLETGGQREYEIDDPYLGKTLVVTCASIFDDQDFLGYVHTARDVTEEKKLKKQLAQAQKMEAIATLAGGIAHDFNNILGAILGNADLLLYRLNSHEKGEGINNREPVTYADIESHLEAIKKAGNRAKDLVSQILAFSRQGKSQRQNVDITPVIKEGIKLLRSSLPANIEIKSEIAPEICQVYADLSQIHQVFMNLCTNAAQAMDEKGGILDVSIRHIAMDDARRHRYHSLKPNRNYVALSVKDTGHGMSPEVMERIFDPFFTTKDVSEGTGMGLAVIHGIITTHGGELDVQSIEGKGSEFTVFFPCIDAKKETEEDAVLGVPRGSETILFVDDEEDILRMSTRMLEYLGYTVYAATSAEKAITMLVDDAIEVDLIITDYSMPGATGVQLAKDILDAGKKIPVILCSGFSDSVILEQDARRGIKKFMSKPLDMKKLAVTIREVLQSTKGNGNAHSDN